MCLDYLLANVKSQPCSCHRLFAANAVKTLKNQRQGLFWNAGTMVNEGNDDLIADLV
jgi:hypothetical protein